MRAVGRGMGALVIERGIDTNNRYELDPGRVVSILAASWITMIMLVTLANLSIVEVDKKVDLTS
jgi:hypothetical protein